MMQCNPFREGRSFGDRGERVDEDGVVVAVDEGSIDGIPAEWWAERFRPFADDRLAGGGENVYA